MISTFEHRCRCSPESLTSISIPLVLLKKNQVLKEQNPVTYEYIKYKSSKVIIHKILNDKINYSFQKGDIFLLFCWFVKSNNATGYNIMYINYCGQFIIITVYLFA